MSDFIYNIAEAPVYNGRLIKKRFDFHKNDTEDNTYIKDSGTLDSATSTTAVLASGASTTDDDYNNLRLKVKSTNDAEQTRKILDYDGSTLTCTVYLWGTTPDNTYKYEVLR